MKFTFSRIFGATALVALTFVIGVQRFAPPASATQSCSGDATGHVYDFGAYCNATPNTGMTGEWESASMQPFNTSSGGFMTSEIWDYTNPNGQQFLEMGIINAWDQEDGWTNPKCSCDAYQYFWGDLSSSTYTFNWIGNGSPSTTEIYYGITSNDNDTWTISLDDTDYATSYDQVTSTGWEAAAGTDIYEWDSSDEAKTFNMYEGIQTNYSWTDPAWNVYYITPGYQCAARSPCLNAQTYSNDEWSWNIAAS